MEEIVNYKIYALYTDEDGIKYIGYTKFQLEKRLKQHKKEAKTLNKDNTYKTKNHRCNWLRKNLNDVKIILIEDDIFNWNITKEREIYWISYYRQSGIKLVNSTNGGDGSLGVKMTEENKEHLRQINTGKKASKETRQKMSEVRRGENNPFSKLTENDVIEIRRLIQNKELSRNEIAKKFNISKCSVNGIIIGRSWKFSKGDIQKRQSKSQQGEKNPRAKVTESDVIEIRRLYSNKEMSLKNIAKQFNVSSGCISKIIHRIRWKHI